MSVCSCKSNCSVVSIIASIIIGVIAAVLRATAVIAVTPAFLWVVLGVAVVYLAIALLTTAHSASPSARGCICPVLSVFLTGVLGAILTSVILLAINFSATSIIGAILTGGLAAFFSLIFTETACLIKCLARCDDAQ